MSIISIKFFGFVILILALYYALPRRAQNYLLLLASYVFYITFSWQFPLVLLGVTWFNFVWAQNFPSDRQRKRWWLRGGILVNLVALAFFKYAEFFVPEVEALFSRLGLQTQTIGLKILLPVGLSFYVLQAISYLVDVSRRQMSAVSAFADFALYMAYFPKLTAGPIERARTFLPKLAEQRIVNNEALARSFTLIIIGLFRKVVIADIMLAAIPAKVFRTPLNYSSLELLAWLLAYVVGLYNDFAGYTNVVRGISGLFGIELSRNFVNPLFSRNFAEFWTRWHITLSQWLRDYIYFPLSRKLVRWNPSRYNLANLILPPVVTMAISGLWHGATWNMLAWGAVMGLYQVIEDIPSLWLPVVSPDKRPIWRQVLAMASILTLSLLAAVLFRMSIPVAFDFWKGLLAGTWTLPVTHEFWVIVPALWIDWVQHRNNNEVVFLTWPRAAQSTLLAFSVLAIFLFSRTRVGAPFIYQGF